MGTTITIEFENDISDEELKDIEAKINKVLQGEAVPEPEVVGQRSPLPVKIRHIRNPGGPRM